MRFANIRELRINSSSVMRNLRKEDVIVTNRGNPVAAIIYMDEDILDSYVIAHHPTLMADINRDVAAWKRGKLRTLTLEEVQARLGLSTRPGRKRPPG